jgi:acylphosphatase
MTDLPGQVRRCQAIISGRVQGVGFRYATEARARELGVGGWVRNRWDGAVEVVAEGPAEAVQRLLAFLQRGPTMAHVADVKLTWQTPLDPETTVRRSFEVRY